MTMLEALVSAIRAGAGLRTPLEKLAAMGAMDEFAVVTLGEVLEELRPERDQQTEQLGLFDAEA